MPKASAATVLVLVIAVVVAVQGTQDLRVMDDTDVQVALDVGKDKGDNAFKHLFASCRAGAGFWATVGADLAGGAQYTGGYWVTFTSHYGQVAMVTAERAVKHLPAPPPSEIPEGLTPAGTASLDRTYWR